MLLLDGGTIAWFASISPFGESNCIGLWLTKGDLLSTKLCSWMEFSLKSKALTYLMVFVIGEITPTSGLVAQYGERGDAGVRHKGNGDASPVVPTIVNDIRAITIK